LKPFSALCEKKRRRKRRRRDEMTDGKIILKGIIELLSPALIGSGNDEHSDCDVILDANGKPFIPATSLIGVLRHQIKSSAINDDELNNFWGYTEKDKGQQSRIICSDLYIDEKKNIEKKSEPEKPVTVVRDGIKIDNKTGIVETDKKKNTGKKYDYEIIEKEAEFELKVEISFTAETKTFCEKMAATIRDVLKNNKLSIGAKTNSGLGKISLKDEKLDEYYFRNNKEDVVKWLTRKDGNPFPATPFSSEKSLFTIDATLKLKNSFIIRSYSEDADAPDSTSMKSGNDYVMTGTSLKGAIRSRAERIVNTIKSPTLAKQIIENLFGYVNENNPHDKAKKGRIQIDEVTLPPFASELQSRIKIDRFTGGVMTGALFDSMPLFSKGQSIENVLITIANYKEYEAGLMLLVLKDLWTGDLAVGGEKNVGRGVFEGIKAEIKWGGNGDATISNDNGQLKIDKNQPILENFVKSLNDYKGEKTNGS
jgi:CRISPR/Cas system CSM-associated protein Csm3 (group 7 of RAMP superfamily)